MTKHSKPRHLAQFSKSVFSSIKRLITAYCLAILFLSLFPASSAFASDTTTREAASNICNIPVNIKNTQPPLNGQPLEVSIGVFLIKISGLNARDGKFQVDAAIHSYWADPRLSVQALGNSLSNCNFQLEDVWHPAVGAINISGKPSYWFKNLKIDDEGNVHYSARVQATLYSVIDLQEFPFDTQSLKVEFTSFRYDNNDVILKGRETSTGRMQDIQIPGWDLINNFNSDNVQPIKSLNEREHSRLNHVITIKRRAGYYIWNYVVPLCLIVLMASSVFWIDPEAFGPQIGISTASVFTLVAFLLGLRQGLPEVAYLTRMDEMVFAATILVFVSFSEVVYVSRLVHKEKSDLARRIDWHARWIFITVFSFLLFFILIKPNI